MQCTEHNVHLLQVGVLWSRFIWCFRFACFAKEHTGTAMKVMGKQPYRVMICKKKVVQAKILQKSSRCWRIVSQDSYAVTPSTVKVQNGTQTLHVVIDKKPRKISVTISMGILLIAVRLSVTDPSWEKLGAHWRRMWQEPTSKSSRQ